MLAGGFQRCVQCVSRPSGRRSRSMQPFLRELVLVIGVERCGSGVAQCDAVAAEVRSEVEALRFG